MNIHPVLIKAEDLSKRYGSKENAFWAVKSLNLEIFEGETLALVGESGSGKSTLGQLLLNLIEPTTGYVTFQGNSFSKLPPKQLIPYRKQMQMIFQDTCGSLNPRMRILNLITEGLKIHSHLSKDEKREQAVQLLELVGLPLSFIDRYPFELSGGQRQRVGIARALALKPQFIICDEPVSSLDTMARTHILNLLKDLKKKLQMTYLLITHDLSVARTFADRIAVMYKGEIVEMAEANAIFESPTHSYTQSLLEALYV